MEEIVGVGFGSYETRREHEVRDGAWGLEVMTRIGRCLPRGLQELLFRPHNIRARVGKGVDRGEGRGEEVRGYGYRGSESGIVFGALRSVKEHRGDTIKIAFSNLI